MEGLSCAHVTLPSGMRLRYLSNRVPRGSLCVLFVHGWPSLAFSWRNQLRACPLHAIAPDLPGFGGSDRPSDPKCLSQRSLTATMLQLLTALEVQRVVVVGHDWGGVVTWSLALTQDERIVGAAALCTPLFPYVGGDAVERMRENPRAFDYQLYFMEEGGKVAAAELDRDVERTLSLVYRTADEAVGAVASSGNVRQRGGLLAGLPEHVVPGMLLQPPEVLREYVAGFSRGFWWSLQLYNNYADNTAFRRETRDVVLSVPCLMITAGRDPILKASYADHMDSMVPRLSRAHVPDSSHWMMEEFPAEVNAALASFFALVQQELKPKL